MSAYLETFAILVALSTQLLCPSAGGGTLHNSSHLGNSGQVTHEKLSNERDFLKANSLKARNALRLTHHAEKAGHSRAKRFAAFKWFYEGFKEQLISEAEDLKRSLPSRGLCYRELGCFKLRDRMRIPYGYPQRPNRIGTRFWLYCTRDSKRRIKVTTSSSAWRLAGCREKGRGRPLIVIVHGFTESAAASWVTSMARALLSVIGANVLLVDWRRGAAAPVYSVAASNTPAVGAELSVVLQRLMRNNSNLMPHDVHIIGFSLGAHVAGFCGRHFLMHTRKRIGRITALDPAGPLFEGTNVSVSRGDADFVDVIHTNMGQLEHLQFGLAASVGDVDFFPNGGSEQPGCHRIACSHQRAHELMIESITNQHCIFTSQPVNSQRDLIAKKINLSSKSLHESGSTGQGAMGYYSISAKGRGIQYIRTRSKPPFCIRE